MTLEEAIKHCLEKSRQCTTECERDHNYYPAARYHKCPKCGEYVMESMICLSCNTIVPTDKMKSLDPDISEFVDKHFNELI